MPIGTPVGNLDIANATLRTSNLETQNIKIGSIFVGTGNSLEETANVGNSMSNTIQFTNTHTAFTTTGNVTVGKELTVTGNVTATSFSGGGSALTALNADNIASGTLDAARIPTLNQSTTGTAGSAATLSTPRTIGGVSFDGSAAIVPTTFGAATFSGPTTGAAHSDGGILYLLDTPIIDEWSWTNSQTTLRITYASSELPANCKAVLAEVFMPKTNNADHVGHSLGKNYNYSATWTSGAGVQPSTIFTLNRQTTFLDMRGDTDNFEYYYGKWFSSVIIPLDTGNTVYHIIGGESGTSTSWVYVVTRGYYI